MADYTIRDIYQGGTSSFNPESGYGNIFTGYTLRAGDLGMSTDARTANVLQETSSKLNMGVKTIELSQVSPDVFEAIPKGQLNEVRRLAKLTGTEVTLHAPVIEPSGMTQQGFDEENRKAIERQMKLAIERAHELNPQGNSPVTFHASVGIPSSILKPVEGERQYQKMIAANVETGKLVPLDEERMHYLETRELKPEIEKRLESGEITQEQIPKGSFIEIPLKEGKLYSAESRLKNINATEWDNSISQLLMNKERMDEILQKNEVQISHLLKDIKELKETDQLTNEQKQALNHYQNANIYLKDTRQHVNNLFHKAYKYGSEEDQKNLEKMRDDFQKDLSKSPSQSNQSQAMQKLMLRMKEEVTPEMYVPVEKFAIAKSSETFANVALYGYNKFGNEASIVSIENPPAGGVLGTGEDLKNLVEATREKFVEKVMKSEKEGGKGLSKSQAEQEAERLIGVTWDVGHINMMRKQGFKEEDIIRESGHVAPLVKHVHLSDNFGMEHTELPMGMGNVPFKEIMDKLGKKGFEAKKVVEAMHWWQHFKTPPFIETLGMSGGSMTTGRGTYWSQSPGLSQGYYSGFGMVLPNINYQTFGAGFSRLPSELGGNAQGNQGSRMGGTPME